MSIFDKLASKIMPPETEDDRANARSLARSLAGDGDWLAIVLEHHQQIESLFAQALTHSDSQGRLAAMKRLQVVLTGHANAEESVLYPALADIGEKGHAAMAYQEQAMTKVEFGLLEKLDPMSQEWQDKLEHIQGAVQHHVYEEEGTWFCQLQQKTPAGDRARLTRRFLEEFQRYTQGQGDVSAPLQMAAHESHSASAPMGQAGMGQPSQSQSGLHQSGMGQSGVGQTGMTQGTTGYGSTAQPGTGQSGIGRTDRDPSGYTPLDE